LRVAWHESSSCRLVRASTPPISPSVLPTGWTTYSLGIAAIWPTELLTD